MLFLQRGDGGGLPPAPLLASGVLVWGKVQKIPALKGCLGNWGNLGVTCFRTSPPPAEADFYWGYTLFGELGEPFRIK